MFCIIGNDFFPLLLVRSHSLRVQHLQPSNEGLVRDEKARLTAFGAAHSSAEFIFPLTISNLIQFDDFITLSE